MSNVPNLSIELAQSVLDTEIDPNTQKPFSVHKAVRNLLVDGTTINVDVALGYPAYSQLGLLRQQLHLAFKAVGFETILINLFSKIQTHSVQRGVKVLPNVKNIIAIASGKGGVGKSTTAVNVALALAAEGACVGLLDADIYGPSQIMMLGITTKPDSIDGKTMQPLQAHGLQVMSIGSMVDPETPMVWRGPMVTQALEQMLGQTNWTDLDYLIVDMPPGTGDIQLTLSQKVPVTGAVIVTTPQDIALLDARKGLKMFEKVGIPILGIVENMALHVCSECGHTEHIFGSGGGERMATQYKVNYLGGLPLDARLRVDTDAGTPTVIADSTSDLTQMYLSIARKIAVAVADKARDFSAKMPIITVSKDS